MRYMVVDRQLVRLDDSCAVFSQRRQLIDRPPFAWRGLITVLFVFSLLPWIQRINPSPATSLPTLWFSFAWMAAFAAGAFQLRRWRKRKRDDFIAAATSLDAEIDLGAYPDEFDAQGIGRTFTVRFSIPDGAVRLCDEKGSELECRPQGSTIRMEHTGHSFPWSDANEGHPHDIAAIYLVVREAPSEDLDGRFIVKSAAIGDPELYEIRTVLRGLPVD